MKTEKEILENLGFQELNDMQKASVNSILHSDKDVVILSPTGTGKTLAYLLPQVQLLDERDDSLQAVIIVPGRELALQSATVLSEMKCGLRACSCYGGRSTMSEHRILRQVNPQIIFATPGRLKDHLEKGNIDANSVKWLVIDEFDKCLEMGFQEEMSSIIGKLKGVRHRVLLSATDAEEIPAYMNRKSMSQVEIIDYLSEKEQVSGRVNIYKVLSPEKDKLTTLEQLLRHLGDQSSIVFLNYRDSVERTAEFLRKKGFAICSFHGGMEQKAREDALYKFSNSSANIFVSTDLASRGLDIPNIDNIIHYHLPENEDSYVHRVGRTARWDAKGRAFFILGPSEHLPEYIEIGPEDYELPRELPEPAHPRMATIYIGKGKKDKISKGDIVGFLCKKGDLSNDEIGQIDVKDRYTYVAVARKKLHQVLKLTKGEKIKGIHTVFEEVR
ncbi:DEAD/DEAH box helicase [Prevotella sp. kh1p2]|uniref:DEAD/DEAH box helicase n=1 Tax=Prevotella sp. kh1p2 TaxID=1761883 RepID=UPI0008BC7CDF|nr:DEAD/DEAH box helicase [Prevotella sp. kh1p2]SET28254.1 Superfamily II DNA and RNA helicase [Prevotella sp. kh1p2]SNU12495.1 Superfamily II DNA and RNA helicase [Prevotellaceae bacterium KH2P17]